MLMLSGTAHSSLLPTLASKAAILSIGYLTLSIVVAKAVVVFLS